MPADEFNLLPKWTEILLNNTIFEREKVLSIVKNLASGASSNRRDGFHMCQQVLHSINDAKHHETRWHEDVVLEKFHRELSKQLEKDDAKAQQIIDDLNALRAAILKSPMNLHLICDPKKLNGKKQPLNVDSWKFLDPVGHDLTPVPKIQVDSLNSLDFMFSV